jgi:hypothetical protein
MVQTRQRDASLCSRILAIGRVTPAGRVTQEESFRLSRYQRDGVRRVFLNSGIDFRHFYFEQEPRLDETSDELNVGDRGDATKGSSPMALTPHSYMKGLLCKPALEALVESSYPWDQTAPACCSSRRAEYPMPAAGLHR